MMHHRMRGSEERKKTAEEKAAEQAKQNAKKRRFEGVEQHFISKTNFKKLKEDLDVYLNGNASLKEGLTNVHSKLKANKDFAIYCDCELCEEFNI